MAVAVLQPLLDDVNSLATSSDKEIALNNFKSLYGENYSNQTNFLSALQLLASEDKINISKTLILECISEDQSIKEKINNKTSQFKQAHEKEISELEEQQSHDFIGRDIKKFEEKINNHAGIILWGAPGVGKTKLAKQFLSSWNGESKEIDLRGVNSIELVCVETLKVFGKAVSIDDASTSLVSRVVSEYPHRNTILLFDNADDFIRYNPDKKADLTDDFILLMEGILKNSSGKIKVIATSREESSSPLAHQYFYQENLAPLDDNAASTIIKKFMIHQKEQHEEIKKATDYCKNLPLALKILGAKLQDKRASLKDLLPIIKREAAQWQKRNNQATEIESFTFGVISARFEALSDTIQICAVALSLFTRDFSFTTVKQVFKSFSEQKLLMVLDYLRHVNFISLEKTNLDRSNLLYDMHPRVREFLAQKTKLKHVTDFYIETRKNFLVYFKEYLLSVSRLIDVDYLKGYEKYQDESSNLEFLLNNCSGELILYEKYEDLQLVGVLLLRMLNPKVRLTFFQTLAKDMLQQGAVLIGVQLLCQAALCEGFFNPITALHYTTLRIEHILRTKEVKKMNNEDYIISRDVEAMYHYTKGQLLYQITHSSHQMQDCDASLKAMELCLTLRQELHPGNHSDLVRSFLNIGNGYNMKKDLCAKGTPEWRRNVDSALTFYKQALDMRQQMSGTDLHFDTPQIYENIGTIYHQNEKYEEAKRCFLTAMEIEKQLKLDGFYNTSTKLVNLGALHQRLKEYKDAYKCYRNAFEIRKAFKGNHKDTVLTLYRMAESKKLDKKYSEAVSYYKEAFEMEESLPADYHSSVRKIIRQRLLQTLEFRMNREAGTEEEYDRFEADKIDWEKKLKKLEIEESKLEIPQPTHAQLSTAMEKMEVDPDDIEIEECLYKQRSIRWKFDIGGGFVDFRYLGVYLTIPSFITDKLSIIELRRINPSCVHLELGELLISDVISIHVSDSAVGESLLKSPAFLEIPCKNTDGNTKYSRLAMSYYDTSANRWKELEKIETSMDECDYFGSVKTFPILQAWIFSFTKFAVISKPNVKKYSIGKDGDTCRPFEDENIEVHFAPGTFQESNCECEIKVINPLNREIRQQNGVQLIISPIINVKTSLKTFSKPVSVKLPLLCQSQDGGTITVLKNDSNSPKNWKDVTDSLKSRMLFQDEAVTFQVTSFSWLLVVWVKDIAMHAKDAALSAVERIFSNVFDATFHLYKRIGRTKYEVPIAVSCIPFTSNREEQEDLRRRPKQGGEFYFVASQPSLKKICDSECAVVKVTGQFDNDAVDLQKRMLRLSKDIGSLNVPTLFKVRRGPMEIEGGDVEIIRETNNELFCNIPYFADFMSSQNEEFTEDGARRKSPFRFLGLRLDHCGLEDLKMTLSDFRNRLYLTGLHHTYIDEIKLSAEHESQQFITRNLLSLITYKFSRDDLEENWFQVFREYLWPDHARQKLIKVFDFLQMPPRLISEGDIIYDCIIADPDLPALSGRLAELFIDEPIKHPSCGKVITNCKQPSKDECWHILSVYSRLKQPKTSLCVIKILLLLLEDFPWTVQRILDNIGNKIEAHLQLIRI